jgi:hypothetical protein
MSYVGDGAILQEGIKDLLSQNSKDIDTYRILILDFILPLTNQQLYRLLLINSNLSSGKYISRDVQQKLQDASKQQQNMRASIDKSRYEFYQRQNNIDYHQFIILIMQVTILLIFLCSAIVGCCLVFNINSIIMWCALTAMVGVYLFMIIAIVSRNNRKRTDDSSKYYFAPYKPS